jgi:hypothetical protein
MDLGMLRLGMGRTRKSEQLCPKVERALLTTGVVTACIALALSVSRCSPLSPSISKNGTIPGHSDPVRINPTPIHVFRYQTVLVHSDTPDGLPGVNAPAGDTLIRLSEQQFVEFKTAGRTEISLPLENTPDHGKGIFRVALNRDQVEIDGLTTFESDLKPGSDGKWILSVPASVEETVSHGVREHLLDVTISVSADET